MRVTTVGLVAAALVGLGGCGQKPLAYGNANSVVAAMDSTLWSQVSDSVHTVLEPTILTVAQERTFSVTYQDPQAPAWGNLQRFKNLLMVGTATDPWMQKPLQQVGKSMKGPGLYQAHDIWAEGQSVELVVLSKPGAASELLGYLPTIHARLDKEFHEWVHGRMFISGIDSALADTLMTQARFSLIVPNVYQWHRSADSVYLFRNDNPDPSQLIRQIAVTWESPIPSTFQEKDLLAWRARIVAKYYLEPQDVNLSAAQSGPFVYRGKQGYRIQAVWKNPPSLGWPGAGPFILRAIPCPQQNRLYLLDAWLYAPGTNKYQYMIELRTILDSFRCGTS